MKNLENNLRDNNLKMLSLDEQVKIDGGFLITFPLFAFAWGVAYGYAVEKSKQ